MLGDLLLLDDLDSSVLCAELMLCSDNLTKGASADNLFYFVEGFNVVGLLDGHEIFKVQLLI